MPVCVQREAGKQKCVLATGRFFRTLEEQMMQDQEEDEEEDEEDSN